MTNAVVLDDDDDAVSFAVTTQVITTGDTTDTAADDGDCSIIVHRSVFVTCRSCRWCCSISLLPVSSFSVWSTERLVIFNMAFEAYTNVDVAGIQVTIWFPLTEAAAP